MSKPNHGFSWANKNEARKKRGRCQFKWHLEDKEENRETKLQHEFRSSHTKPNNSFKRFKLELNNVAVLLNHLCFFRALPFEWQHILIKQKQNLNKKNTLFLFSLIKKTKTANETAREWMPFFLALFPSTPAIESISLPRTNAINGISNWIWFVHRQHRADNPNHNNLWWQSIPNDLRLGCSIWCTLRWFRSAIDVKVRPRSFAWLSLCLLPFIMVINYQFISFFSLCIPMITSLPHSWCLTHLIWLDLIRFFFCCFDFSWWKFMQATRFTRRRRWKKNRTSGRVHRHCVTFDIAQRPKADRNQTESRDPRARRVSAKASA